MKIRMISVLVCLLMLLNLLTGCGAVDKLAEDVTKDSVNTTAVVDSADESESSPADEGADSSVYVEEPEASDDSGEPEASDDSGEPENEEIDFFTRYGQGVLPEKAEIPDYCTPADVKYLYKCDLHLPSAEGFSAHAANGILLLFYWDEEYQYCYMISLETGEQIKQISIPGTCRWGQFTNGGFWTADQNTLEVKFYDTLGNEKVMKQGKENWDERYPNALYVTDDGKYFITGYPRGVRGEIYSFETDATINPMLPANVNPWDIYETSKGIYFDGADGTSYVYNIETEESLIIQSDMSYVDFYGDICQISADGYISLGSVFAEDERFYVSANRDSYLQDLKYGCAVIPDNFASSIAFSDLRRGVSVSINMSEEAYGVFATLLENGTALIISFSDNGRDSYIYDLASALRDENEIVESEAIVLTDAQLNEMISEAAEEVYNKHGVELIYGSEGNDFYIYDYVGVAELDLYEVYYAVDSVKSILDNYPEGMLREAYSETNKGLKFYLCGSIYGVQDSSLDAASGVTTDINGYIVVVLDINDSLLYNVHHELSHVFDNRIQQISDNGETNWMALWDAATPFENAYSYSYDEYTDNNNFTIYGEESPEDVWFIDGYARTFPTEDRARILEYLFVSTEDAPYDIYAYENLVNKAKLYSYILRQCFPSCNNESPNYWEEKLGVIDSSVVPDIDNPVALG